MKLSPKRSSLRLGVGLLRAAAAALACCALMMTRPAAADGVVRGLVIGIDSYAHLPPLRGATADALDLQRSLTALGARDPSVLLDAEATRAATLARLDRLAGAVGKDDLVFVSLATLGGQTPAANGGSENVFLLHGYDPHGGQKGEVISTRELAGFVARIERAGGHAVVVADTCFGGSDARTVDPRTSDLTYRCRETASASRSGPVDAAGLFGASSGFARSVVLAASALNIRAPELRISGKGFRGALSYVTARALDGAADANGDGVITAAELLDYVRQTVHQLSDQRQQAAFVAPAAQEAPVARLRSRGVSVRPVQADADEGLSIVAADEDGRIQSGASSAVGGGSSLIEASAATGRQQQSGDGGRIAVRPIRLASLDGNTNRLSDLQREQSVVLVDANSNPDLLWDPRTLDVLAGRDVVARNITPADMPGVVDQALALTWLKQRATLASQQIRMLPGDQLHTKGTRIEISVDQLTNRFLVLFNLSGNGSAQLLYPLGSDPPQRLDAAYSVAFQVQEPFGADHIVAVSSSKPLTELERTLRQSSRRLPPERLASALRGADARVGFVGLFTSP